MSKTIPIALQAHKALPATTLCDLLKVGPLEDGTIYGFTSLDKDVTYDDGSGDGAVTYRAHTGFNGSAQIASADLSVDNAEAESLEATYTVPGVTQAAIDAGLFDKAPFVMYRVNYRDLTMGHEVLAAGTVGEQTLKVGGVAVLELRSLSQQLKQSVVELDSLTCRVKQFGSQPGDERFPCGYDLTAEWVNFTVTEVGDEVTRTFVTDDISEADNYYAPGLVEWETGDNAGQQVEIELHEGIIGGPATAEITTGITFTQSSEYGVGGFAATPTNMRDGDSTTGAATNNGASEWIRADLGSAKVVGRVDVAGGNLAIWGQVALFLNGAVIQYSNDGSSWTTAATISGVDDTGTLFPFNFTQVSARYWRIQRAGFLSTTEFRLYQPDTVTAGRITQQFTLPEAIQVGDTGRLRRDCTRAWTGHNSCTTYWGADKGLHFRGEPYIPVGDPVMAPGAEQ